MFIFHGGGELLDYLRELFPAGWQELPLLLPVMRAVAVKIP